MFIITLPYLTLPLDPVSVSTLLILISLPHSQCPLFFPLFPLPLFPLLTSHVVVVVVAVAYVADMSVSDVVMWSRVNWLPLAVFAIKVSQVRPSGNKSCTSIRARQYLPLGKTQECDPTLSQFSVGLPRQVGSSISRDQSAFGGKVIAASIRHWLHSHHRLADQHRRSACVR